jgi:pimeloyl-ACP methyl ester carboxylesterase
LALCGGAGSTFVMAARHPDRVSCLVEVSPVTVPYEPETGLVERWLDRLMMGSPTIMTMWMGTMGLLLRRFPETAIRLQLSEPAESTLERADAAKLARRIMADPYRAAFATRVWATYTNRTRQRFPGTVNEMAQVAALSRLPLAEVTCPTLVVHGRAQVLSVRNVQAIRDAIPAAEVRSPERGIHRGLWLDDDWAEQQAYVLDWVRANARQGGAVAFRHEGAHPDA